MKITYTSIKFSLNTTLFLIQILFYSFEMHLWDTSLTHSPLFFIFIASKRQAEAIFDSLCLMNSYSISDISRMYLPIVRVSMEALAHCQKKPNTSCIQCTFPCTLANEFSVNSYITIHEILKILVSCLVYQYYHIRTQNIKFICTSTYFYNNTFVDIKENDNIKSLILEGRRFKQYEHIVEFYFAVKLLCLF